jgi:hypothetical protein
MNKGRFLNTHKGCACAAMLLLYLAGCALINPPQKNPQAGPALSGIRITEINYNPVGEGTVDGDEYEFIEIKNTGDKAIDLTSVAFTDGIEYAFDAGTMLEPGKFLVLASSATHFAARYGFTPAGVYTGKLNNAGEKIALRDLKTDTVFLAVEYSDQSPWPTAADGGGCSLVLVTNENPDDFANAAHWRASSQLNGSPGTDDPAVAFINAALTCTRYCIATDTKIFSTTIGVSAFGQRYSAFIPKTGTRAPRARGKSTYYGIQSA